ncbi:hypothetical protein COB64_02405 [Candidatus Wolfebacteria bacterium]|nr:MAG: hypothetical protein COB64_02405 [Candidatus Wolfebacteria bacterium]
MKDIIIKRYTFNRLTKSIKEKLRQGVLLNFPDVEVFKTRFYYQIPPNFMFIAWHKGGIVGQRYLTTKVRPIDGKKYKVAGIGITISKEFQGKGLGKELTKEVLRFIQNSDYDFVMATTSNKIAIHVLNKFGFTKLKRKITYKDIKTRKIITEDETVMVKDFQDNRLIKEIEKSKKPIYMGVGVW